MDAVNASMSSLSTSASSSSTTTTHRKKSSPSSTTMNEPISQDTLTNMGLLSSFSVASQSDTSKTNTLLHSVSSSDHPPTPSSSTSLKKKNSSSSKHSSVEASSSKRKPSELKFKMESIGIQPEEDDDLDMCPARTRAVWPRNRQLIPWWQPSKPDDRPPYSYATLIAFAILISQDGRLLLSDIYRWISENYPIFSMKAPNWQNSIRHNLSLNKKFFLKVDRRPTQANPGKGCYWTLVPGKEQWFMEIITKADAHKGKNHDIGLTAELSMGHRNNLMVKHHYHSSSHSAGPPRPPPGSGATFSNANMKITRPEDYQPKRSSRRKSSSSATTDAGTGHSDNKKKPTSTSSSTPTPTSSSPPTATPKSCKPVTAAPSLGPMYSTFRMTSTTMESVSQASQDTNQQKKMKRHITDDDPTLDMMINTKRAKWMPCMDGDDEMMDDYLQMDHDDNQSDCDSGVDISNELQDGKKNTTTTTAAMVPGGDVFTSTMTDNGGLALTNETTAAFGMYNVLDYFLDQLPLPFQQGDDATATASSLFDNNNNNNNHLYTSTPGFPMAPSDIDPVLGYPSFDYYSTNGFFYDGNNNNNNSNNDMVAQAPMNDMYPTLLTSRFNPPSDGDESDPVVTGGAAAAQGGDEEMVRSNHNDSCQFGMMTMMADNVVQPPSQTATTASAAPTATKGPLVIHLNGAPTVTNGGGGGGDVGMKEEDDMADAFLKFEDDDGMPDTTNKDMMMMMTSLDYPEMPVADTLATADGAFRHDFLNYNFTTMSDLLQS
ncbi:hypothetical protein BCR42DRAFT_455855 [Absidia repens]|uniref:Fork-head domain-containing protein n=1 Tax=Absidia repens TaxID=90262 RepID=A0A1X2I2T0_9FUNG|nr:hypothetical protein BCR42DRAFT_455855 [Absidia repens]